MTATGVKERLGYKIDNERISVVFEKQMIVDAKELAKKRGITHSEFYREAIYRYIEFLKESEQRL